MSTTCEQAMLVGSREQAVSIYAAAFREAERYKWIESEKRGFDAGSSALREWYRIHWPGFCRRRRLEHLQGRRCWEEFGDDHFGQWHTHFGDDDLLVDRILDRFFAGMENLELINWAYDWGLPVERVVEILTRLDMNRARLEPKRV